MFHDNTLKTTIINLYGGPGTGKSTSAAFLYYLLKAEGKNVELVREYVKDWVWEGRTINTYDQLYFLGKQVRRESMLYGKVNWIVSDSPVFMNLFYASKYCPPLVSSGVSAGTLSFYQQAQTDGHRHVHVFLKRNKPYLSEGRYQTEAEAVEIDDGIKKMLTQLNVSFIESSPDEPDLVEALQTIKNQVENKA
jgi:hypothetical protein